MDSIWKYIKIHIVKHWKRRAPIFLTYGFTVLDGLTFLESILLKLFAFLLVTAIWLLIDEKIKEGYFFNPNDLGRLTHETLTVLVLPILLPIAIYMKKRRNRS